MFYTLLLFLAISGYTVATILIAKGISTQSANDQQHQHGTAINSVFIIASLSLIAHAWYAIELSHIGNSINLSLTSMTCLVSLILVLIFLLGSLTMPIRSLGILVFPLTVISLFFSYLWGNTSDSTDYSPQTLAFAAHILVSLLAYSLITIAAIQALLYLYQERLIKNRAASTMLLTLPPLQTMEQLLFRLVTIGFVLLSLTLFSGALFSQEIFGQAFTLKHHTIFALLSWMVFAVLLYKHHKSNMVGSQAVKWTLAGFLLMQIGYFGTKIVTESLNLQ